MIEFDPDKDAINIAKHSYSLAGAAAVFEGRFVEEVDARYDYEETRFVATGPVAAIENRVFVVVYTWRAGNRRVISFRKANEKEARKYRDSHTGAT